MDEYNYPRVFPMSVFQFRGYLLPATLGLLALETHAESLYIVVTVSMPAEARVLTTIVSFIIPLNI